MRGAQQPADFLVAQDDREGWSRGLLCHRRRRVGADHANAVQPAEQHLERGDAPRQCLGAARCVALALHPGQIILQVLGGDVVQPRCAVHEAGKDLQVVAKGLDRVVAEALAHHEFVEGVHGGVQRTVGTQRRRQPCPLGVLRCLRRSISGWKRSIVGCRRFLWRGSGRHQFRVWHVDAPCRSSTLRIVNN